MSSSSTSMPPSPQPQPQPKRQRWLDRDPDDADLDRLEDFGEDQHGISPSQWAYAASLIAAGSVLGAHATGQGPMGVLVAAGASAGFAAAGRLGQRPDRPSQAWSDVTGTATGAGLALAQVVLRRSRPSWVGAHLGLVAVAGVAYFGSRAWGSASELRQL